MTISPATSGFIKGLLMVVVLSVVSYLADAAHFGGILSPAIATIAAAVFSAVESDLKANSGGNLGLFGAARIR